MNEGLDAAMAGLARICSRCGYDLRGVQSSVCPECGKPIPMSPKAAASEPGGMKVIGAGEAPPTTVLTHRSPAEAPGPPLPAMIWMLLGLAAMCLLVLATALLQKSTDDHGWMLGLTLAPAGLAAALYVARK